MKVVITDWELGDEDPARGILEPAGFEVVVAQCREAAEVVDVAGEADALMVRHAPVTAPVFDALGQLRFISRMGIGPWAVDLEAAEEHKVAVAHCPEYCTEEAVAHTMALVLALNRRLAAAWTAAREGRWSAAARLAPILPLSEVTIGLIGLGRMGHGIARAAAALGMEVLGHDPYVLGAPEEVEEVDLETLLAESDFVCLLCPASEETYHLIDQAALSQMKPTAYLINTARGALVDERALADALDEGRLAGAALDVLEIEPPTPDHPLLHRPDVWITPHVGFYSEHSQHELKVHAARSVVHYFAGEQVASLLTPDFRRI